MSFLTSREQVAPQGIGKPIRRREDARLLTGGGRFADDMRLPGQVYAYIVRSPHAHARIASIDTGPAEQPLPFGGWRKFFDRYLARMAKNGGVWAKIPSVSSELMKARSRHPLAG
jgi:Aldehyde oxidase and xanthine dehydrogenase, a/b hammerhead domain